MLVISIISSMLFTGCLYRNGAAYDLLEDTNWYDDIKDYYDLSVYGQDDYKKIDHAHKDAFDSAFNDIEILGAKFCLPMKVSELPEGFELSDGYSSEYAPVSGKGSVGRPISGGMSEYHFDLYYDGEVRIVGLSVICGKDQSIDDGIIYEMNFGISYAQPVLLGGSAAVNSDLNEMKEYLGEGNSFYHEGDLSSSDYINQIYTDGNRIIEFSYIAYDDDNIYFSFGNMKACELFIM